MGEPGYDRHTLTKDKNTDPMKCPRCGGSMDNNNNRMWCDDCERRDRFFADTQPIHRRGREMHLEIETDYAPITEDWLKEVGFKWHQLSRQPEKHWLLWLGDAVRDGNGFSSHEDLGVVVSQVSLGDDSRWHCWLRADLSCRYSRFIHTRHLRTQSDLIALVEGVTGHTWNPENNLYGSMRTPDQAARIRKDNERMDRTIMRERHWRDIEKDDSRGGALPEHLEAYEKAGLKNNRDL